MGDVGGGGKEGSEGALLVTAQPVASLGYKGTLALCTSTPQSSLPSLLLLAHSQRKEKKLETCLSG